ncbi:hypothetical protein FDP41_006201 [Naegleria fowleri]|uniref:Uncharacterized protein n=1 Tax=Naegleria fowleri TaxID=5763 RepID=A0A6A5BCB3_NAEFO|nr:uncharacterized protein FDP41_006201 [Naegleria fowleri]KAF0974727.1 hypothetical protein FDP41_006201 [Naegleria fowleri]CAG4708112.1 unnamed protein product [Naegleria fowleri]
MSTESIRQFIQSQIDEMNQSSNKCTLRLAGTICIVVVPAFLCLLFGLLSIVMTYSDSEWGYWKKWPFIGISIGMFVCTCTMLVVALLDRRRFLRQPKEKELKEKENYNNHHYAVSVTTNLPPQPLLNQPHPMVCEPIQPNAPPYMQSHWQDK